MNKKSRIVIAEDHTILREGLRSLLSSSSDFEIVGEAEDKKGRAFPQIPLLSFCDKRDRNVGATKLFRNFKTAPVDRGQALHRLLKNAHLRRSPHPSPCQARGRLVAAYIQVRLTPQDFRRLASGHF